MNEHKPIVQSEAEHPAKPFTRFFNTGASQNGKRTSDLEAIMHKLSLIVSVASLALMIVGLATLALSGEALAIPGDSVVPLGELLDFGQRSFALIAMSSGIVLLALLPTLRVCIAAWLYLRRRHWLDMVIALVVLAELLLSALTE